MDKLEKLPPKDIKPFKDSPIAQGILSNTIFQIIWNGLYFMVGLLIRHYALIFGMPPWLALFLGVIAFFLMALSVNLLRRRKNARDLSAATIEALEPASSALPPDKRTIEIFSPFDGEEVGLYETVRGRVLPPDQALQVVVFAPDQNWYPQKPVDVKGEYWSVKCQFGQLEGRGGDGFKIAAVLGTMLDEEMWYGSLPEGVQSNVVRVRRQETIIEQRLLKAQNDLVEANKRTNDQRTQKEDILTELRKREADLAELKTLSDMRLTQAENIPSYIVVYKVKAGDLMFVGNTETGPCVTLELRIRNESLFNISIKPDDVKGSLGFADSQLREPISVIIDFAREPISNLKPLEWAGLVLYQPLRVADVEWIKSLQDSPKGCFRLTNLYIPITVDSQYKVVGNLKIPSALESIAANTFRVTQNA